MGKSQCRDAPGSATGIVLFACATGPATGAVVTAPVVDRGPYVDGRQWDMTGGLCKQLAHCYTGSIYWKYASGS